MSKIEGKKITINNKQFIIVADNRKGSGSIGFGTVGIEDANGEYYVESGMYFCDEAPYFNENSFNMDKI